MEIRACPKCGSKHIDAGTIGAGIMYGITSWKSMCKECGYQGEPLIFNSEVAYSKFLDGIKNTSNEEGIELENALEDIDEKENQEIKELIGDLTETSISAAEPLFEKKRWGIEILISMVIAAVFVVFPTSTSYDLIGLIMYNMLVFVVMTIMILFGIVIIEYCAKKLKILIMK